MRVTMVSPMRASVWTITWALAFWNHANAQTTTGSASALSFSIASLPTLTSCETATLQWSVTGSGVANYNVTFYALGTSSDGSSAASSTTAKQTTAAISTRSVAERASISDTLFTVSASDTAQSFIVTLPPGRYYIHGQLNGPSSFGVNSQLFSVVAGTDTYCLSGGVAPTSSSSIASSATSVTRSLSSTSATSAKSSNSAATSVGAGSAATSAAASVSDNSESKSGLSGGAIAGVAIAAVLAIGIVFMIWFCVRRRRRQRDDESQPSMRSRGISAFGNPFAGGSNGSEHEGVSPSGPGDHRAGHIALTSMGGSSDEHEKDEGPFSSASSGSHTPVFLPQIGPGESSDNTPTTPRNDPFASTPTTPMGGTDDDRRRSQPPITTPIMTSDRTRSNSQPSDGPSGKVTVKRNVSARRKPVPSLGAELRDQLRGEDAQRRNGHGGKQDDEMASTKEVLRASYQLMPDPPRPINE